jgi:hypothetical protein
MWPPNVVSFAQKYGVYVAIAGLVILILSVTYCTGSKAGKQSEINDQLERTIETQKKVTDANENSANSRVQDRVTIEQQQKELDDAISQSREDSITLRQRRGCLIMRQQGRDTSNLASCRRFESSDGT